MSLVCGRDARAVGEVVGLAALMERTSGSPEVRIGLIDGPVVADHPDLASENLRDLRAGGVCVHAGSIACMHGTFVAGILSGKRGSAAPSICPGCTLLLRPIFSEAISGNETLPVAMPRDLAVAILECIDAGARILNLSLAVEESSARREQELTEALNVAVRRGVIVVAAAGNQSILGSSAITRHPWVIPVVACELHGRPVADSNLCGSIGRRGLRAPGSGITSLGTDGGTRTLAGTSVAAPFVTGAIALLWSEFPTMTAATIRLAVTQRITTRRRSVVPPLLDAEAARRRLSSTNVIRQAA